MKSAEQLINTGVIKHDDEKCFWTDTYYYSRDETEELYKRNGLEVIGHFAQDGISPLLREKVEPSIQQNLMLVQLSSWYMS